MSRNVTDYSDLMRAIGDGTDAASNCPDTSLRHETCFGKRSGAPAFGAPKQFSRLSILSGVCRIGRREARQDVPVLGADADRKNFDAIREQRLGERLAGELACLRGEDDFLALHQRVGTAFQLPVLSGRRRVLVVAVHVLAMLSCSPSARVAAQPRAVSAAGTVVPRIPCPLRSAHDGIVTNGQTDYEIRGYLQSGYSSATLYSASLEAHG